LLEWRRENPTSRLRDKAWLRAARTVKTTIERETGFKKPKKFFMKLDTYLKKGNTAPTEDDIDYQEVSDGEGEVQGVWIAKEEDDGMYEFVDQNSKKTKLSTLVTNRDGLEYRENQAENAYKRTASSVNATTKVKVAKTFRSFATSNADNQMLGFTFSNPD
jgi:hypothetical protein